MSSLTKLVTAPWILLATAVGLTGCDAYDPTASTQSIELVKVSGGGKDLTILTEADRHDSLVVKVVDRNGQPVAGVEVIWTQDDPEGEMHQSISTTGTNGEAWSRWTVSGLPTTYSASASVADLTPVEFSFTVRSADVRQVQLNCALLTDGRLACAETLWGQLREVLPSRRFVALTSFQGESSSGPPSSICALSTDGALWCAPWTNGIPSFSPFEAGQPPLRAFATRSTSFCGVSVGGELWCWGLSWHGSRGDGDGSSQLNYQPTARRVDVPGMGSVKDVSMGGRYGCALGAAGDVWCWGRNADGVVAPGDASVLNEVLTPRRIPTLEPAQVVTTSGENTACAIGQSGRIFCWGDPLFSGQVGATPAGDQRYIASTSRFTTLAAVGSGFLGTTREGRLEYWGSLSYGHFVFIPLPVALPLPDGVTIDAVLTQRGGNNLANCVRLGGGRGTVCMDWADRLWYRAPSRWFGMLPPLPASAL